MNVDLERTDQRLDRIQSIQPLIEALHTISLAKWRNALNRIEYLENYLDKLESIRDKTLAQIEVKTASECKITFLLMIGSQRGFCGNYNRNLHKEFLSGFEKNQFKSKKVYVYGEKLVQIFSREKISYTPIPPLAPVQENFTEATVTKAIHNIFSGSDNCGLMVLFNAYRGAGNFKTELKSLKRTKYKTLRQENQPVIFDTDADQVLNYLDKRLFNLKLMLYFLSATASENATRFRIMESARDNAEDMVEELESLIQQKRRQKITQEMRELAVGAGLLNK